MTEIERQNTLLKASNDNNLKMNLGEALKTLSALAKHDDLVVLIGDGRAMGEESAKQITRINAHNDVIAVLISDPMEEEIVKSSSLFFTDGVDTVDVDSSTHSFREKYKARRDVMRDKMGQLSRKNALPVVVISTESPVLDQLYAQLNVPRGRR